MVIGSGGTGNSALQLKSYNFTTGKEGEPLLLFSPSHLANQLASMARSIEGFSGLTNSLTYVPRGRTPSHGWFLTTHREIEDKLPRLFAQGREDIRVSFLQQGQDITVGSGGSSTRPSPTGSSSGETSYSATADFTVNNLLAVGAYAVTGIPEPENSYQRAGTDIESILESPATNWENQFYVVHVTDWRYIAHLSMVTDATNTRSRYWEGLSSSSSTDQYLRGASTSWSNTVQTLWDLLPAGEGDPLDQTDASYPSSNFPWNEKFWGMTAWDALWSILDQSNNTLVRNLAGNYSVKQFSSDGTNVTGTVNRTGAAEEQETYVGDLTSISNDFGGFTIPEKVRVVFPKWDYQWQTSADSNEVTPQDYWHNRPVWYYEITTSDILTDSGISNRIVPGTKKLLHSSTFAQFTPRTSIDYTEADSVASKAVPLNSAELESDATSRATNYLNTFTNDVTILDKTYRGFIPFTPTHALSSILWADSGSSGPITRILNLPRNQGGKLDRVESALGSTSTGGGGGGPSAAYDPQASSSQRVANEFPGSPDHARMEEPVLRWAMVRLNTDCSPEAEVVAKVEFGIPQASDATSDPGSQMILFYASGESSSTAKTINVTNLSRIAQSGVTVPANTRVVAFWSEQIRKWVFAPPGGVGEGVVGGDICADISGHQVVVGGAHAGDRYMDAYGFAFITNYTHAIGDHGCINPAQAIRVNKETHLSAYTRAGAYSDGDCVGDAAIAPEAEMLITIDPSIDTGGSVFWSDGDIVRWTKAPHIGKEVLLGDGKVGIDPPRLRFQHSETATLSSPAALTDFFSIICRRVDTDLVTGEAPYTSEVTGINQEIVLPNDTTAFIPGQHLSIKATGTGDANCLKLRWTARGIYKSFTVITEVDFAGATTKERTLYFDDGILIGVTNPDTGALEGNDWYRPDNTHAGCVYQGYVVPDPCHPSFYGGSGPHDTASGAGEGPFAH